MAIETLITPWFGVPNNRQDALRAGCPHYFTGKPCKHGHLSRRHAKDRRCMQCSLIITQKWAARPENKARFLAWSRANKECRLAASKKSKAKHREKVRARMQDWHHRNREIVAEKRKVWAAANKPKIYALNAARRGREILATPPWASQFQNEYEAIYAERLRIEEETGLKYHVDHIYPLKGKDSCGLHVPWNLRVIPARENIQKKNHPPEDITMCLTESGYRYLGADSKNSVVRAP